MPHAQRVDALVAAFRREFGRPPEGIAEAPGRVNLIGEHVDYNDGVVLPFAIDRSVLCAWARGGDGVAHAWSVDLSDHCQFSPDEIVPASGGGWSTYVTGVAGALSEASHRLSGLDLAIAGDVPQGAGLSSSAALEVAIAGAFRDALALSIDDVALAKLCQRAENVFVGVQCGIMDQFVSTLSRRDHALLLDCRSLAYEHVPLRLEAAGLAIVVVNSAVKRELATSAYNERRRECEEAVAELRSRLGRPSLASLRDVTEAEMQSLAVDTVPLRRAGHVVGETARVGDAAEALRRDDFTRFGELMRASHESLRDDYEVSSSELDLLVGLALAQPYAVGSRLTGAGFGGCTVNIVRADRVAAFEREVVAPYRERTGLPAVMYVTSACDGLRTWRI